MLSGEAKCGLSLRTQTEDFSEFSLTFIGRTSSPRVAQGLLQPSAAEQLRRAKLAVGQQRRHHCGLHGSRWLHASRCAI